jgi:hypothetical protein
VFDKSGLPLNAADLFLLNQHNAFDSTVARIYINKRWADQLSLGTLDTVVTAPYALCSSAIKDELTSHSILKYRRPPNVEDVREIYTGFFKDWTYFTANIDRYFFKPPLAFSLYPTEGKETYFVRQLLLFLLLAVLFVWMIFIVLGRRGAQADPQQEPEKTADVLRT